jgi:hypothetical protein
MKYQVYHSKPAQFHQHLYIYISSIFEIGGSHITYLCGKSQRTTYDIRYTIYDIRYTIYDIRYTTYDIRYTIYDIRYTIYDIRHTIYDIRYTIYDIRRTDTTGR